MWQLPYLQYRSWEQIRDSDLGQRAVVSETYNFGGGLRHCGGCYWLYEAKDARMSCTALMDRRLKYIPISIRDFVRVNGQLTLLVHGPVRFDSLGFT